MNAETIFAEIDALNDAYLKAAGQEAGVQSYGLVSDALIAWYREKAR